MLKRIISTYINYFINYFYGEITDADSEYKNAVSYIITSIIVIPLYLLYAYIHMYEHHLPFLSLVNLIASVFLIILLFMSKKIRHFPLFFGIGLAVTNIPLALGSYYIDGGVGTSLFWTVIVVLIAEIFGTKLTRNIVLPFTISCQIGVTVTDYLDIHYAFAEFSREQFVKYKFMQIFMTTMTVIAMTNIYRHILNQTLKDSEIKNDHIKHFIRLLCHDIANPLHVIIARSEKGLKSNNTSSTNHKFFRRIEHSGQIISRILQQVRSYEQLHENKLSIEIAHVRISTMLNNVAEQLEDQLVEKDLKLVINNDLSNSSEVISEEFSLENHVLINILSNAIKFSYHGETISINISKVNEYIEVSFIDKGVGIPKEILKNIFTMSESALGLELKESQESVTDSLLQKSILSFMAVKYISPVPRNFMVPQIMEPP